MHRKTPSTAIWILLAWLVAQAACASPSDPADRARDIERRILAPCCRRQTLEDHESELAHALRAEISGRVEGGEPTVAIEGDLVRRYGDDIRAMPRGWDPRMLLGGAVAIILAAGGLAVLWLMRRRPGSTTTVPAADDAVNTTYADRLDDELLAVD
jgi:cytochrome c-type biogenesis protein CcmH